MKGAIKIKKLYILLIFVLFLFGCSNNHNQSSSSYTIDNNYVTLNFEKFGFDFDIYCDDGVILEESNMNFYDLKNYIIFDNSTSLNDFFTTTYILDGIDAISDYNDDYFANYKALVVYYVGSPSYVDSVFEEVKYYNDDLRIYYHSVKGEGIVVNAVIKFNFIDLTEN